VEGDGGCLGKFSNMINLISRAKKCGTIDHGEVPSELTSATPAVPSEKESSSSSSRSDVHQITTKKN